jgi:SAM-dependent methyltransferase
MNDNLSSRASKAGVPRHDGWDAYWQRNARGSRRLYSAIASVYRRIFICTRLSYWLRRTFPAGAKLLHAGCGSGEVDAFVGTRYRITALDISPGALERYRSSNTHAAGFIHADLMNLPDVLAGSFDGAYHLGVLEHFEPDDIRKILLNLRTVIRAGGKMVIFWPLASAPSVKVLGAWHRLLNKGGRNSVELHPPEVSLIRSRQEAVKLIQLGGWRVLSYSVSASDLYIQAVIVCE